MAPKVKSSSTSSGSIEGQCMKCKKKQTMNSPKLTKKNGRCFYKGTCPVCGTKMSRITSCK